MVMTLLDHWKLSTEDQAALAVAPTPQTLAALATAFRADPAALQAVVAVAVTIPALGTPDAVVATIATVANVPVATITAPTTATTEAAAPATDGPVGGTVGATLTSGSSSGSSSSASPS
jgi:hypothetical protein